MLIYVGSYTPAAGGKGEGITVLTADGGRLRPAGPVVPAPAPSFLAAHPHAPVLYAVHEADDGEVAAYGRRPDGGLTPLARRPSGGAAPCHVTVAGDGRYVLAANYGSGSVAVWRTTDDGDLAERTDLVTHHGTGPDPDRQEAAHAHHVVVAGDEVMVVDLGADGLFTYHLDPVTGELSDLPGVAAEPGSGPRHLVRHPSGACYVADELSSTVSVFAPGPGGRLRLAHRRPATLAAPAGVNQPAEIALSPDGRLLYVGNRGNDTVATFAVDGEALRPVAEEPTGGAWPRHFALAGDVLYVANERSHAVTAMPLVDGVPRAGAPVAEVPSPACVLPVG